MQAVIGEYNNHGWNQQETLRQINHAINDDVSDDSQSNFRPSQIDSMKEDYKSDKITAKDIYLPPFKEGQTEK